ncbi:hypothetical protein MKK63_06355 [Methylobacterium sp. J-088]|uniref:hypothetical protein n=1 Tax=Methylobacterium sp. J-088 TaxID=2836664 RepID=UPI001FBB2279|nr:hypothetical protein [Methylobacterium sp. J-088]MCJ2062323.1 hypothetical protein [Methylobacterium sp. J-088]
MPHGARTSLAALILLIGVGGATAEPAAGTTWTDPPTHKPAAEAPASDRKAPAPAAAPTASTPAAVAAEARPAPAQRKMAARHAPAQTTAARHAPARTTATRSAPARIAARRASPERLEASVSRARTAAAPPRAIVGPRVVALVPPPPEGYARYRPYGYGPGYGPGYADERLDRLHSAAAAGYLVVRRRTVQFPDGRTLRVYRPDDGEPF